MTSVRASRRSGALVGVEQLVCDMERLLQRDPGDDAGGADRAADPEPVAALAERGLGGLDHSDVGARSGGDDEFVAPDSVDGAEVADHRCEPVSEPGEKGIACRMAEAVVVGLEAVQIEDRDRHGLLGAERADLSLHVGEQLAPVPEPRERVGRRFVVTQSPLSDRAVEGEREGQQKGQDGRDRPDVATFRERVASRP